jgi:hypothetical protein
MRNISWKALTFELLLALYLSIPIPSWSACPPPRYNPDQTECGKTAFDDRFSAAPLTADERREISLLSPGVREMHAIQDQWIDRQSPATVRARMHEIQRDAHYHMQYLANQAADERCWAKALEGFGQRNQLESQARRDGTPFSWQYGVETRMQFDRDYKACSSGPSNPAKVIDHHAFIEAEHRVMTNYLDHCPVTTELQHWLDQDTAALRAGNADEVRRLHELLESHREDCRLTGDR